MECVFIQSENMRNRHHNAETHNNGNALNIAYGYVTPVIIIVIINAFLAWAFVI